MNPRCHLRIFALSAFRLVILLFIACQTGSSSFAQEQPRFARAIEWMGKGIWLKADTHIHTRFSDGSNTVEQVVAKAVENGCQVVAITDHADRNLSAATADYFEAIEVARRTHPETIVIAGLEWNLPPFNGDEHVSILVPPGSSESLTLATFKFEFDGLGVTHGEEQATRAFEWLAAKYSGDEQQPVLAYNHPSRKQKGPDDFIAVYRSLTKSCPLFIGFSGAPGHQGSKALGSYKGSLETIDRWDPVAAEIGGTWDRLLGEGIDVWGAISPSDFHNADPKGLNDFWPGAFSEIWIYSPDRTAAGVLAALRAGSFFGVHGHIARQVTLSVNATGLDRPAQAGEAINVRAGDQVQITFNATVPQTDYLGNPNAIDEVEVIAATAEGAQVIASGPMTDQGFACVYTVPTKGACIRARARRVLENEPDLLAYTNPIRIQTEISEEPLAQSASISGELPGVDSPTSNSVLTGEKLFSSYRQLLGSLLLALTVLALVVSLIGRRSTTKLPMGTLVKQTLNRSLLVLALLFTVFAAYGSCMPFNFTSGLQWTEAVSRFRQAFVEGRWITSRSDFVSNVMLFIPISFFWFAYFSNAARSALLRTLTLLAVPPLVILLSVIIELAQMWLPGRVSSAGDVFAHSIGNVAGIVAWAILGKRFTQWLRTFLLPSTQSQRSLALLQAYCLGLLIYSVLPMDFTISPAELYRKFKGVRFDSLLGGSPENPVGFLLDCLVDTALWMPVGVLAYAWARERRTVPKLVRHTPLPLWSLSLLLAFNAVIVSEFAQLFVLSRVVDLRDLILGLLGVLLGFSAAVYHARQTNSRKGKSAAVSFLFLGTVAYSVFLVAMFCKPLEWNWDSASIQSRAMGLSRLPFLLFLEGRNENFLMELARKIGFFVPLGLLGQRMLYLSTKRVLSHQTYALAFFCLCVAVGIEILQVLLTTHVPDFTDSILYFTGSVAGIILGGYLSSNVDSPSESNDVYIVSPTGVIDIEVTGKRRRPKRRLQWVGFPVIGVTFVSVLAALVQARWNLPVTQASTSQPVEQKAEPQPKVVQQFFTSAPPNPTDAPRLTRLPIPDLPGEAAIWGSSGRDSQGHLWFGISTHDGADPRTAYLLEFDPEKNTFTNRGDVLSQLKKLGKYRDGEGQEKIHSRIVQLADGNLYFSSMDEEGERDQGETLPRWGSHLWRVNPKKDYAWEHLAAVPEGLIAVAGTGRYAYSLGYFGHVLYQYDTQTGVLQSERVGSVEAHVSRNLFTDDREHVYVPEVAYGTGTADSIQVRLVELDRDLNRVRAFPLDYYGSGKPYEIHGIVGFQPLADRSIAFVTADGYLYSVIPPLDESAAAVEGLGYFHPQGPSYTPSLFTFTGERYLIGASRRKLAGQRLSDWLVFDLRDNQSIAWPMDLSELSTQRLFSETLLYGSITRDNAGNPYLVGSIHEQYEDGSKRALPLILKGEW